MIKAPIMSKLKVAVIVDSTMASINIYDLVKWGKTQNHIEISHLIINNKKVIKDEFTFSASNLNHLFRSSLFRLICKIESIKIKKNPKYEDSFKLHDLSNYIKTNIQVYPVISKSSSDYSYNDIDIKKIKEHEFDVIIQCARGVISGDVLTVSKYGVISLSQYSDKFDYSEYDIFWKIYERKDSTSFFIKQLNEGNDRLLLKGNITTQTYYMLGLISRNEKKYYYLQQILLNIAKNREIHYDVNVFPCFENRSAPGIQIQINYFFCLILRQLREVFNNNLYKKEFRVAFSFSNWRDVDMSKGIKIDNPQSHYLADPFVVDYKNQNYCFVEDFDCSISRGCIVVYELFKDRTNRLGTAIVEPFHLAYPYIFQYNFKLYICPDSSNNKDIRLYECESFPLKWKLKKILISNIDAADSNLFEKDGLWWLFTNPDGNNKGYHSQELCIYYSDNLLSDDWTPHPKNPIYVDSMRARNGGILFDNDMVYRVSQQPGINIYGKSTSINLITILTKTDYNEEMLHTIEPTFFSGIEGTHHMHSSGNVTVYDFINKIKR